MRAGRSSLFCGTDLAGRIERVEAQLMTETSRAARRRRADAAGFVIPVESDLVVAGARCYLAWRDGVIAGGASVRMADGIAHFTGAATVPVHRRRGVQTALLSARLADAAAAGCDIAVITTAPGSVSQQNVQRQGFDLLYTRAVLVRHA